ncbi:MAG: DUF1937 family protein [Candidatus Paceibacterota bacterium]|jgi:hypothetical protein
MKIVYIAGQLTTGWDGKDRNFLAEKINEAEKYQVALVNAGVGCFCPHAHTSFHYEKGSVAPESFYYEMDMEFLKRAADALLAMPGWEKSKGAKVEVEWAAKNNLQIFYPKSAGDINDIIVWSQNNK